MSIKIYVKYVKNNRDFHTTKLNLPTGNLDSKTSEVLINLFQDIYEKMNKTIIMVTHDPLVASHCKRIIFLKDGQILEELKREGTREAFYNQIIGRMQNL